MKIKKESSENNPRFKMMEGGVTLKEIEKWYGKDTATALVQYCDKMGLEIDDVAGDDRAWDKFEAWSKSKKRKLGTNSTKFNNWQRAARVDDYDSGKRARTYDGPSDSDIYDEGSGSEPVDEYFISNWIGEELQDCEWVDPSEIQYAGDEPWVEISTPDGDVYRIQVTKVFSSKLGSYLDER